MFSQHYKHISFYTIKAIDRNSFTQTCIRNYSFECRLYILVILQVIWELERKEKGLKDKQSFVDVGCGNGLLVHLLAKEGVCIGKPTLTALLYYTLS